MKPRHKFGAKPVTRDGIRFASKKEGRRYDQLELLRKSGSVLFFLRQTPFHLPGNTKYVCDFTIFYADGTVVFEDVKGYDTPLSKHKRSIVESLYGIEITIV